MTTRLLKSHQQLYFKLSFAVLSLHVVFFSITRIEGESAMVTSVVMAVTILILIQTSCSTYIFSKIRKVEQ